MSKHFGGSVCKMRITAPQILRKVFLRWQKLFLVRWAALADPEGHCSPSSGARTGPGGSVPPLLLPCYPEHVLSVLTGTRPLPRVARCLCRGPDVKSQREPSLGCQSGKARESTHL